MTTNKTYSRGQTLVEAVIATALVTLVLGALISAITYSLANAQFARNKAVATKYGQEAIEFLRINRDSNWSTFYAESSAGGRKHCLVSATGDLSSLTDPSMVPPECNIIDDAYDVFRRDVTLTGTGGDSVMVTVVVTWPQGTTTQRVTLDTNLTKWK